jgi:hypothetical protein
VVGVEEVFPASREEPGDDLFHETNIGRQTIREAAHQIIRIVNVEERGGHRGGGRGRGASHGAPRKFPNVSLRVNNLSRPEQQPVPHEEEHHEDETPHVEEDVNGEDGQDEEMFEDDEPDQPFQEIHEPELDNPEEREKFYQEVCLPYIYLFAETYSL